MSDLATSALLLLLCSLCAAAGWLEQAKENFHKRNRARALSKRQWQYPEPSPDLSFDLETAPPPKFRAFRSAYTRHTIEIQKLDQDSWLDRDWPRYYEAKVARLANRGDKVVKTRPAAAAAAFELCQDLAEFLVRRYPQVYQITRTKTDTCGWYGLGSIMAVEIPRFGAKFDLLREDPLTVAGLIQPADLNILIKRDDGKYYLEAMMIAIGGAQRLQDKRELQRTKPLTDDAVGLSLADLHLTGHVPKYKEQLERPLDRYLSKVKVEAPLQRNTTSISTHDDLHWPTKTMGPEDDWDPVLRRPGVDTPSSGTWKPPGPVTDVSELWFRQERQVLRRLPRSGALVWMVHTYIEPMAEVAQEPGVPGRLAALVRSWDDDLAQHKGRENYADVLLPYLDALHQKQLADGVLQDGEPPHQYPY